jgi:hypothetical protein
MVITSTLAFVAAAAFVALGAAFVAVFFTAFAIVLTLFESSLRMSDARLYRKIRRFETFPRIHADVKIGYPV